MIKLLEPFSGRHPISVCSDCSNDDGPSEKTRFTFPGRLLRKTFLPLTQETRSVVAWDEKKGGEGRGRWPTLN